MPVKANLVFSGFVSKIMVDTHQHLSAR